MVGLGVSDGIIDEVGLGSGVQSGSGLATVSATVLEPGSGSDSVLVTALSTVSSSGSGAQSGSGLATVSATVLAP